MGNAVISIVLPVHNVAEVLPACLDSILEQSHADLEIVAVDDASPDESGAILDEYAARDSRVRVIHLAENAGLGGARNAGLAQARGEYVWFVDSDDWLEPLAVASVARRLEQVGTVDVLVVDYVRTFPDGRDEANPRAEVLRAPGPAVGSLRSRPDLLMLLPVVWNKIYRRDWLAESGFTFYDGYYEDVAWTYPTLVAAQRIAVLDRVCVHYRQGRATSILGAADRRHFEVFGQYARVFAYLDAHRELESWRVPIFDRMLRHYAMLLTLPDRIPDAQRREFFDAAARSYREWEPVGWRIPRGTTGIKPRAFALGSYPAFLAAERASELPHLLRRRRATPMVTPALSVTATPVESVPVPVVVPVVEPVVEPEPVVLPEPEPVPEPPVAPPASAPERGPERGPERKASRRPFGRRRGDDVGLDGLFGSTDDPAGPGDQ